MSATGTRRREAGRLRAAWAFALRRPALVAAAVAAAVFLNALPNRAVLDDGWAVLDNPLVRTFDIPRILGAEYGHAGGATVAGLYRPVATLTYAISYAIHGRAPFGYHLVNLLLHAAATALVVLLARRLLLAAAPGRVAAGSLLAGLLFAVHPAHVEAVAPIVARADLLAAVLGLGALLLALAPRSPWRLAAAFGALLAAVLSKETAGAVPILYLLVALLLPGAASLDAPPGPGPSGRRTLLRVAGTAAVLAAAVLLYFALRPGTGALPVDARWFGSRPPSVVALTMTRVLAEYVRLLVFPATLATDFGHAARIPFALRFGAEQAAATAIWGAALLAGLLSWRRAPLRALAILWLFTGLLPVMNVVPMGALMAERFLYLPSVGLCVWAGQLPVAAWERLRRPSGRAALGAAVALLLLLLAGRSVARNAEWRTPASLFEAELRHAPLDPVVNNNLAVEYTARGENRRALERLDVALRAAPRYWRAHVNRGIALQRLGNGEGALGAFAAAELIAPGEASPKFFAALVHAGRGDPERALALLEQAERLSPEDPRTVLRAAKLLLGLERIPEAREKLRRAVELDPADPEPRRLLKATESR